MLIICCRHLALLDFAVAAGEQGRALVALAFADDELRRRLGQLVGLAFELATAVRSGLTQLVEDAAGGFH